MNERMNKMASEEHAEQPVNEEPVIIIPQTVEHTR